MACTEAIMRKRSSAELNNQQDADGASKRRATQPSPSSSAAVHHGDACKSSSMPAYPAQWPAMPVPFMTPPPFIMMPPFGCMGFPPMPFPCGPMQFPCGPWGPQPGAWTPQQTAWMQQQYSAYHASLQQNFLASTPALESSKSLSEQPSSATASTANASSQPPMSADSLEAIEFEFESFIDSFLDNNAGTADDLLEPLAGSLDDCLVESPSSPSLEGPAPKCAPLNLKMNSETALVELALEGN